jgi:uncharacterized membrane protein
MLGRFLSEDKQRALQRFIPTRKQTIIIISIITVLMIGVVIVRYFNAAYQILQEHEYLEYQRDLTRLELFKMIILIYALLAICAICIAVSIKTKLEYIFLTTVISIGLLYLIAITPFSTPDELHHYRSANILAGYILFEENPFLFNVQYADYTSLIEHHNWPISYLRLIDEGIRFIDKSNVELVAIPEPYDINYLPYMLPQTIGITLARLIGLNIFGLVFIGSFFNLIFYGFCGFFSIRRLKAFRLPIFIVGLLPMHLHQAASLSYDAFINGMSMILIAYSISCIYEKDSFHWSDYLWLLIPAVLLAPTKGVYLPLSLLAFVVAWKWKQEIKWKAWLLAASIIVASIIATIVIFGERTSVVLGDDMETWHGGDNYTLSFVLENPIQTLTIFINTLQRDAVLYAKTAMGWKLSGFNFYLPPLYMNSIIVLFFASVLYGNRDEWHPKIRERVAYILIAIATCLLCMASMFFGHTAYGTAWITGIQGRYFTPVLPMVLLIIKHKKIQIPYDNYKNMLIVATVLLHGLIIYYVLSHTISKLVYL